MELFWYCYYKDDDNIIETFIPCNEKGQEQAPDDIKATPSIAYAIFIKILEQDWKIIPPNRWEEGKYLLADVVFPCLCGYVQRNTIHSSKLLMVCPVNKRLIKTINEELSVFGINLDHLF